MARAEGALALQATITPGVCAAVIPFTISTRTHMANNLNITGLASAMSGLDTLTDQVKSTKSYRVGSPVHYGEKLERGTRNMPPYPWLGPAIEEVTARGGGLLDSASGPDEFIQLVALQIQREATQRLESDSMRPYRQSGNLAGSVEIVPGDG